MLFVIVNVRILIKFNVLKGDDFMPKTFNTAAICIPQEHYMVNTDSRVKEIKQLVDAGKYFTINRARQYGKTTILRALYRYLQKEYYVVLLDFQLFGSAEFQTEMRFATAFAEAFLNQFERRQANLSEKMTEALNHLKVQIDYGKNEKKSLVLRSLFGELSNICEVADKPLVLMIDEVDSASNNQVFLDFLAQLRARYIDRDIEPTFKSVILAGVYDIKNLKRKLRDDGEHKYNSPWNIAADFNVDMSFSKEEIEEMLDEYEADYHTGMNTGEIAGWIYDYTSGYPFLVSRICQLLDERISQEEEYNSKKDVWTRKGFNEAIRMILSEKNTLFESLITKIKDYPELNQMIQEVLFKGKSITYNSDETSIDIATMFGFIKNQNGKVAIANRIFETRLYNYYLSTAEMQGKEIYSKSLLDKNQFVTGGHLNMRLILEKFVMHFHDIYGDSDEKFIENEGRKYFLLYLRPIINGVGNYYIESETREQRRTDIIVDYLGEQYIIELKIWHGQEYNRRGEEQLAEYLDNYHLSTGYMVSFNFNKKKEIGVHDIVIGEKRILEAVV